MLKLRLTAAIVWCAIGVIAQTHAAAADGLEFDALTPEVRTRIDNRALQVRDQSGQAAGGPVMGKLAGRAASRLPLPLEVERRAADAILEELAADHRIASTPASADAVLDSLTRTWRSTQRSAERGQTVFRIVVVRDLVPASATPGAGVLLLDEAYLRDALSNSPRSRERLAFMLAHLIGRNLRGHTHRAYAVLEAQELLDDEVLPEIDPAPARRAPAALIRLARRAIALASRRQQQLEADLFATHLCRNADFDLDACLDPLRLDALDGDEAAYVRLKHLRYELDGVFNDERFGLFAFDADQRRFERSELRAPAEGARAIVVIHGMGSQLDRLRPLATDLLDNLEGVDAVYGFQYPGDGSLARAGRALFRALQPLGQSAERLDFVCHSAGGLVFRWYAEVEGGRFGRAVFLGTPHGGSNLARLRELLEAKQFLGDLKLGLREALDNVVIDGDGQIEYDLLPGSLFLGYLDRHDGDPSRYSIIRGRRLGRPRALLLQTSLGAARIALRREAPDRIGVGPFRKDVDRLIDRLEAPPQILEGDLAVSVDSAALEGVERIETLKLSHNKLHSDPEALALIRELLLKSP